MIRWADTKATSGARPAGAVTERTLGSDPTDEELMLRLRGGDGAACRALMERYRAPLYGYLARMLSSRDDAEDLFQEAFVRVLRHVDRFDGRRRFRPWLYAIATNLVRNTYRSRGYRQALTLDDPGPDEDGERLAAQLAARGRAPAREAERAESREAVRRAVEELPERGRAALVLYYYQGLSYDEIAQALEIPKGTVKSRIHNAVARLTQALAEETTGDPGV